MDFDKIECEYCDVCGVIRLERKMVEEKEGAPWRENDLKYTYYCIDCVLEPLKEYSYIKEQIENIKNHGTRFYYGE